MTAALIGSLLLIPFSDVQWGHLVCYTPTSQTSISLNLFFPFSSFFQNPPGSCVVVGFVWPQHCPVFITPLTGYPGPSRTCAAPRSLQECAGACNRLCGGHWVVWLTETSQPHSALAAEWGSAWGGSPNHGRCQIPTVAPHNHSHTGPDIPPGRGDGEGRGLGVCWWWASVLGSAQKWKSLHLTPNKTDTFLRYIATLDWLFG